MPVNKGFSHFVRSPYFYFEGESIFLENVKEEISCLVIYENGVFLMMTKSAGIPLSRYVL
jgi:hypothetical protein